MPYNFGVYLKPFPVQMMSVFNDIFVINTIFFHFSFWFKMKRGSSNILNKKTHLSKFGMK